MVILDAQQVGLAAHLAVFHVGLAASGRFVDRRDVPLSAGGALETGFHLAGELTSVAEAKSQRLANGTTKVVPFPIVFHPYILFHPYNDESISLWHREC